MGFFDATTGRYALLQSLHTANQDRLSLCKYMHECLSLNVCMSIYIPVYNSGVVPGTSGEVGTIKGHTAGAFWARELQDGINGDGNLKPARRAEADMSNKWCCLNPTFLTHYCFISTLLSISIAMCWLFFCSG